MSIIPIPADMVEGSECLAYGVPWIVPEAIFKLDDILKKDDVVLEVGTGGSALFYARRTGGVVAIETNPNWAEKVEKVAKENGLTKIVFKTILQEDLICGVIIDLGEMMKSITVFSVDTQGGYDRSKILNAFLASKIHPRLRIIIIDNYSHEGLFPLHHDKILDLGEGWEHFDFNHDRWAGSGTRVYVKKEK